jgi:hypothetical protein
MRLVALLGLLISFSAATLFAAGSDADRFVDSAKKLIQEINGDDSAAIEASFDAGMQQTLPLDKTTTFFHGLVSAKGKLKEAKAPQVTGSTAIVKVTAERGAWDFKITLDESDKISGLLITASVGKATAPNSPQRYIKVVGKLMQAINADDSATIQALLDIQAQQAMPPDKASEFFRGLVSAAGKLKGAGAPKITDSTAIIRVAAERGAWDFKIKLDEADKISEIYVTPSGSNSAASATNKSAIREWSDVSGKFHIKAELIGVKDGNVQLKKSDGQVITVPVEKLSAQDQDALKKLSPANVK